ncbi:dockerin type I repeat-containing protein, partial [Patescibacteria group bacterium]|nr:dockerin type I repeat-containing protein [Patescibacteria group bacterium]
FPVSVTAGATTNIGGIFIAPTISVDKSEVKQGDNLAIFGQSSPGSIVTIAVHSNTPLFVQTPSDSKGAYLYTLDTSVLDFGNHLAQSKAALADAISGFGPSVGFVVGDQNVARPTKTACRTGDLNCDGRVDLVDFSIMLYWYQRPLAGAGLKADLNNDGKVDLTDFSILVANWTG